MISTIVVKDEEGPKFFHSWSSKVVKELWRQWVLVSDAPSHLAKVSIRKVNWDWHNGRRLSHDIKCKNAPSSFSSGKISTSDVVIKLVGFIVIRFGLAPGQSEFGAIGTLEKIFIQVHENVDSEADINIDMAFHQLGEGRHVGYNPCILESILLIKNPSVFVHRGGVPKRKGKTKNALAVFVAASSLHLTMHGADIKMGFRVHVESWYQIEENRIVSLWGKASRDYGVDEGERKLWGNLIEKLI